MFETCWRSIAVQKINLQAAVPRFYMLYLYIPKAKQILIKEEITANSIEHIAMFNNDDCETAFIQEASVDVQQFCEKGEHVPL